MNKWIYMYIHYHHHYPFHQRISLECSLMWDVVVTWYCFSCLAKRRIRGRRSGTVLVCARVAIAIAVANKKFACSLYFVTIQPIEFIGTVLAFRFSVLWQRIQLVNRDELPWFYLLASVINHGWYSSAISVLIRHPHSSGRLKSNFAYVVADDWLAITAVPFGLILIEIQYRIDCE